MCLERETGNAGKKESRGAGSPRPRLSASVIFIWDYRAFCGNEKGLLYNLAEKGT
jgi:hypothetical protein